MGEGADIEAVVVRALSVELKVSEDAIRTMASLKDGCRMDSISAANVAFALEEELGIEIEIEKGDAFDSLGDIVALVTRCVAGKAN
ncbi:acyl carrier protein [Candidatus Binatia bacterium]|nr:acyl carrier protein [Candidatus Binatia bacterium]